MSDKQLLHLVIGGELQDLNGTTFKDLKAIEFVGAYPNNAIVGASGGIATGAALRRKLSGAKGITVANSGDGSTGCGPVWEAMNFASMAQFETLWGAQRGGLPVLFFFNNNFYAMGGQTIGETMGWDRLSRIGAAINPASMHAETVGRVLDCGAKIGDTGRDRAQRDEVGAGRLCDDPGQRRLARAGRSPENDRRELIRRDRLAQERAGTDDRLMADQIVERAGPHSGRQRRPSRQLLLPVGVEEVQGHAFVFREWSKPASAMTAGPPARRLER